MPQTATDQEVFSDYWSRRDALTASEWTDFYYRVRKALMRCPAPELSAISDSRESYIDEFFTEKLFFTAQRAPTTGIQSISGGALCLFFRRFLIDKIRGRKQEDSLDENVPDNDATPVTTAPDNHIDKLLAHIGGHEALALSVDTFLAQLEDWALLMLCGHFCADDDEAIAMSTLCRGIPAYHYKAQSLGITVKKNAANFLGYEHTRIGQWVKGMGVDIVPENRPAIGFLLEALCLEATAEAGEGAP